MTLGNTIPSNVARAAALASYEKVTSSRPSLSALYDGVFDTVCARFMAAFIRMVRQTAEMFHHVYQKRVKATILYATETGRSRNYANIVKEFFERNFASQVRVTSSSNSQWCCVQ